jgi:hypothetical protein
MNATKIELYGFDLLVELEPQTTNPCLAVVSHAGVVRQAGPAHVGQPEPIQVGDRVVILPQTAKYLAAAGKRCAIVGADALVWRFTK